MKHFAHLTLLAVAFSFTSTTAGIAQITYNFTPPVAGSPPAAYWGDGSSWTPASVPTANDLAAFNNPNNLAAYSVNVDGNYAVRALQFGSSAAATTTTFNASSKHSNGAPTNVNSQLTLTGGVGANGSVLANDGLTTLFAPNSATGTTITLKPIIFLASPANVWEIQSGVTVNVTGQVQAASGTGTTLTKIGSGTLVLSNNNNSLNMWDGGLTVAAGTVLANDPSFGAASTGSGPVTVRSGATLGGNGGISTLLDANSNPQYVTVNGGGTLTAGTDAAHHTLKITGQTQGLQHGGLLMDSNSKLSVKLFGTGATDIGLVAVSGSATINTNKISLDLGALSDTDVGNLRAGGPRTYTILTASDKLAGSGFDSAGFSISNLGQFSTGEWSFGSFNTNGDDNFAGIVTLVFTPVPEPGTVLGLAVVSWGLVVALRRVRVKRADALLGLAASDRP